MPSPFASSMSRRALSRTWPTLPAGPSSSSTVAVWIESTITRLGWVARAISVILPTSLSASTAIASLDGPVSSPRRCARSRTWAAIPRH